MYGIIGEVEKFVIGVKEKEFIKYSSSYEVIGEKLSKMKMKIIDNDNNKRVLGIIKSNTESKAVNFEDNVILGVKCTYYNTETGNVSHGELSQRQFLGCLLKKKIKYCYKDLSNNIFICKDTPRDMLEYKKIDNNIFKEVTLDTELSIEVMTQDNRCIKVPVSATYKVSCEEDVDASPILFSELESLAEIQTDKFKRENLQKQLHITIDEFNNEYIDDIDMLKYNTSDVRKAKILKIYERRFSLVSK